MSRRPEFLTFDVGDAELGALRWAGIEGAPTIIAVHGITSNSWSWDTVAHHLSGGANLIALDLRGRSRSYQAPGPFGIAQHAEDVSRVIGAVGGPCLVAGHSMGAYVALMTAEQHPKAVIDVVLVDGGTPLPLPDNADVDEVLDATLGPAIERLRKVWVDRTSYYSMWSAHPAFADGISIDLERNLLADLIEADGGFRTAVNETAVRVDGRDLFVDDDVRSLLNRRTTATRIVRAPNGLMGTPPPLISEEAVADANKHRWTTVPGTNHYTVLMGPVGAAAVANALRSELTGA
jgi:pimeloyl-ACP methyl ester carboxylesterase